MSKPADLISAGRRGLIRFVDRLAAVDQQVDHAQHMRRAAVVLAVIIGLVFLVNRQWLYENTLVNSPAYDALVYQNQSYDDYWLVRREGLPALMTRYTTSGQWYIPPHVPPLHILAGTLSYLVLGRDPANFYIGPTIWLYLFVLGTYGFVRYWTGNAAWASLGAAMALTPQSVLSFGLRVAQTDFSVGAAYTWAIYLLVASHGLLSRRTTLWYALSVSLCVLIKSSIVPYFLAHGLIFLVFFISEPAHRVKRLTNGVLAAGVVLALTGWFFYYNYTHMIIYYSRWGGELSNVSRSYAGISSITDDLLFYLWSFKTLHITDRNFYLYLAATTFSGVVFLLLLVRSHGTFIRRRTCLSLAAACIWLTIPYVILTSYASKAFSVDFPFLAAFLVIPILLAAAVFQGRTILIGILIFLPFLAAQTRDQSLLLVQNQGIQDWREREVLAAIFKDAAEHDRKEIVVGSAFIHRTLTSENLRFFVVNGTFAEWQGLYRPLQTGVYFEASEQYQQLLKADYILTKDKLYEPLLHPNNQMAPEVNRLLAATPDLSVVGRYGLPDGSTLTVYRNDGRSGVSHLPFQTDGWIGPRFPLTFFGKVQARRVDVSGRILLPPALPFPAQIYLENERGEVVSSRATVPDDVPFTVTLDVPVSAFGPGGGNRTLYLTTDRIYRPSDHGGSTDTRELSMLLRSITEAKP